MKPILPFALFVTVILCASVFADNLVTKDGHTFYDVSVITNQCTVDMAAITNRDGIAKVAYTNMFAFDRDKYCYNLDKFIAAREIKGHMLSYEQEKINEMEAASETRPTTSSGGGKGSGGGRKGGHRGGGSGGN